MSNPHKNVTKHRGSSSSGSPKPTNQRGSRSNKNTITEDQAKTFSECTQNCNICKNEVDDRSIQCDTCSKWTHQKCTTLTTSEFDLLQLGNQHIVFNCTPCLQENTKNNNRLQKLEKEVNEHSKLLNTMNDMILLLRDQNRTLQQQNEMILKLVESDKTREQRIKTQIEEVLDEQKEKEEIQNNIMIFNVPEADPNDEVNEDTKKLKEILTIVEPNISIDDVKEKMTRLGKRKTDAARPRPIKLTLKNQQQRNKILKASRKLKENNIYNNVNISHEKTRKEKEEYQKLKVELTEKNKGGNNYVIFKNEVVLRTSRDTMLSEQRGGNHPPPGNN